MKSAVRRSLSNQLARSPATDSSNQIPLVRSQVTGLMKRFFKRAVRKNGSHMGMSIDGNGETFAVFDERGEAVETERLTELINRHKMVQSDSGIPAADALWTVTMLLEILSQSDRPLSDVLDELGMIG